MTRILDHPGLRPDEIAYETGDATWPTARVRITPMDAAQEDRFHEPNGEPLPLRIVARFSASLIDEAGSVERIAGKLLLGPEGVHSWQFDADVPFDPDAWKDECAERVISELLRQARGISAAAAAGLMN